MISAKKIANQICRDVGLSLCYKNISLGSLVTSKHFSLLISGQNDIKKLRRENEQLRREIWSLRDEYDKLEEILKKQKNRDESEEYEVGSLIFNCVMKHNENTLK